MNIDTRIYGYIGDGFIVCPACAEKNHGEDGSGDELRPLSAYSGIFDRPCGETCEDCHEWIVEPDEDHGKGTPCDECGAFQLDVVQFVIDYEAGDLDEDEVVAGFQYLIDSGLLAGLQGHYHRVAAYLADQGRISA